MRYKKMVFNKSRIHGFLCLSIAEAENKSLSIISTQESKKKSKKYEMKYSKCQHLISA